MRLEKRCVQIVTGLGLAGLGWAKWLSVREAREEPNIEYIFVRRQKPERRKPFRHKLALFFAL
jgi:hypothetical protein